MSATTQEAITQSRPRIRRDVLFTETEEGVLFHNAQSGFHLKAASAYRFSSLIVPYLNGEHRVADICAGLGNQQRDMVAELVQMLYRRGFARDVPAGNGDNGAVLSPEVANRFASQIAYVDHHVDNAEQRFHRFRSTRVAVVGTDLIARWCAISLVRNGCAAIGVEPGPDRAETGFDEVRAEADALAGLGSPADITLLRGDGGPLGWSDLQSYDVVVVTPGPDGPHQLFSLLTEGVPVGRTLVPAWQLGERAIIGPLMRPDRAGCWVCATLRLGANGAAGDAADLWSSICIPAGSEPRGARPSRPLAAMIGNLLGYEIFRIRTGALPAETDGRVIVQDMNSLDVVSEPLLPHPRCPFCADRGAAILPAESLELNDSDVGAPPRPVDQEAEALLTDLNTRQILIQPNAGPFRRFTDEPWTQTPLKVSTIELAVGHTVRREIAAFDIHTVVGARMRALHAAASVYAEHLAPLTGVTDLQAAPTRYPGSRIVAPSWLDGASGFDVTDTDVPAWVPATSLVRGDIAMVPAAAVHPFGSYNDGRWFVPTSGGTGSGATTSEAAKRGLLSAISANALRRAVRGSSRVSAIPLDPDSGNAEYAFLIRSARNLDVRLELLDLGEGERSSAHVLLARALHPDTGAWVWAIGSEISWAAAAIAAMRDLLGTVQLGREPAGAAAAGGTSRVDTGDPIMADLEPGAVTERTERPAALGATSSWARILERLGGAGRDALVVSTTPADLAAASVSTVRVLLTSGDSHAC